MVRRGRASLKKLGDGVSRAGKKIGFGEEKFSCFRSQRFFLILKVFVYKEDRTQILRPGKKIPYTILHVTSLLLSK